MNKPPPIHPSLEADDDLEEGGTADASRHFQPIERRVKGDQREDDDGGDLSQIHGEIV